jgi:transposase-like protein
VKRRLSESLVRRILADLDSGQGVTSVARKHSKPRSTIYEIQKRQRGTKPAPVAATRPEEVPTEHTLEERGDGGSLTYTTHEAPRNERDMIEQARIDTSTWYVDRWKCGSYQVTLKLRTFADDALEEIVRKARIVREEPRTITMYRVEVQLKRVAPKPYLDAANALFDRYANSAPRFSKSPALKLTRDAHLAVVDMMDVHLGKYAWEREVGKNFDLKTVSDDFKFGIDELRARLSPYQLGKILMPFGNDFFHFDNNQSATTAGTRVDSDGRLAKVIEAGEELMIWACERLAQVVPLEVYWIPGNHDHQSSYFTARILKAHFRNHDRITVDCDPTTRKYKVFGQNLLGFVHGHTVKLKDLPTLMAVEKKTDWGKTSCWEWHTGHFHSSKKFETMQVEEQKGVTVRQLSALTDTDSWHFDNGFVGCRRAAEAYLYHPQDGYAGHVVAPLRKRERLSA